MSVIYRIMGKKGRITIPFETRIKLGFAYNDVLSFTEGRDGKSVIVRRERICDNCAKGPPDDRSSTAVKGLLDGLTDDQQRAALIYLNSKWGE